MRPPRTLVVGDLHGCSAEFDALLAAAGYTPDDRLVLAGDLVAKGPDSKGVVERARRLGALAVLGNHDAHVLGVRDGRPSSAAARAAAATLDADDWAYLDRLPLWLDFPELNTVVVHAGLVPGVPLDQQQREWCINLRSITPDGAPSKRIEAGVPWASRWPGPRFVVFGHDAVRGVQHHLFALGLDSGCVYGKALTAVWLPQRTLVSVPAQRVWQPIEPD